MRPLLRKRRLSAAVNMGRPETASSWSRVPMDSFVTRMLTQYPVRTNALIAGGMGAGDDAFPPHHPEGPSLHIS
jgi:hypothetical protein